MKRGYTRKEAAVQAVGESALKKEKTVPFAGKAMSIFLWHSPGAILIDKVLGKRQDYHRITFHH